MPPEAVPTPNVLSVEGDYITGISLTNQNILFIATYYEGIFSLVLGLQGLTQIMNPFGSGTLGFSTFSIDNQLKYYYFAILSNEGMIIGICNIKSNQIWLPSKIIINNQINMNNFLQTQVYINARYVIVANDNGISVYPNILNEINEGKLLYYYPQNSIVSLFDYQNNILISISDIGTYTYQFNNPVLSTSQQQQIEIAQEFSITAKTNSFNQTAIQCETFIFFFQVVQQPNPENIQIYQTFYNDEQQINTYYYQQGQQYNMQFGSQQIININKLLIGPALFITQPQIQPAISNDPTINFKIILNTPKIYNQYRSNSNQFNNQQVIYSQLFPDPLIISGQNSEIEDDYYQLAQLEKSIVLYQCQGLQNTPCEEIYSIEQSGIVVEQFAFGLGMNEIFFAYLYNEVTVDGKSIGYVSCYQLLLTSSGITQQHTNYQLPNKNNVYVKQIAIIQSVFYFLYSIEETVQGQSNMVLETQLYGINAADVAIGVKSLSHATQFDLGNLFVEKFTYNVASYGNILFLNAYSISNTGQYTYYLTLANYFLYDTEIIGSVILPFAQGTDIKLKVFYELTNDGIYCINNQLEPFPQIFFYPRVDLLPYIYYANQLQTQTLSPPIQPIDIPIYNISNIKYTASTPRFMYLLAQQQNQYSYSIFVYKYTPSILNSLYYIITEDDIVDDPFSAVGALQYDAIIFRSRGSNGYQNSIILPEYQLHVNCNPYSNSRYQIEYNYLGFKANSLLYQTQLVQQEWISFQIINLVSFVREITTITDQYQNGSYLAFNTNGQTYLDPRSYFTGNIQTFSLNNLTSDSGYYLNMITPVVSQPQRQVQNNPVTAVSTILQFDNSNQQNQYWCTFVQTNHLVLITPYIYYNPPTQAQVENTIVYIDYPMSYKLPILDQSVNLQHCPLIFIDQLSQGVVSVCGTKNGNQFLTSFTLYNPILKKVQDTQVINLITAFSINLQINEESAIYNLNSATYLDIGIVVLQFQYTDNFGQLPPIDIILSFIYYANLNSAIVVNMYGQSSYQMIQPIQNIYYIPNEEIADSFTITPFSISNQFMGGLQTDNNTSFMMFGLICVTNNDEACLASEINALLSNGAIITIYFNDGFNLNGSQNIYIQSTNNQTNDVYSNITQVNFYVSILSILQDYSLTSIQQIIQAGSAVTDAFVYSVPFIVVSQGTAFVIKLQFYQANAEFTASQYLCTLIGLTNSNKMLKVAVAGYGSNIQVVAVVSNPTTKNINQVTLLNYGIINQWCQGSSSNDSIFNNVVTAIGSYTYTSLESFPILSLMFPQSYGDEQFSNIPRTLISNNSAIHLLDTSPKLILNAYPNYNVYQGVTLSNLTGTISFKGITAQVTAEPIKTYVNDHILNGASGSTQFIFNLTNPPNWTTGKWFHQIKGQFIWGSIMFVIIVGIWVFLFYKSQPQYQNIKILIKIIEQFFLSLLRINQIVKLSQISEQFVRAASNSLYLLAFNNEFLGNQSLENIKISDIDLVGVSFYKSDLNSSDFQNVSISSCNFSEANLNNINWTQIQCDELHSLIGHQSNIDGILFSNDGQILISYSNANNNIFSWNIEEGKQTDQYQYSDLKKLNKFEYQQYESNFIIEKLKFSNDNQILVIQWYLFIEAYTDSFDTNAIQVFDLKAKKSLGFKNFDYNAQIKDYSLSHDSNILALCWKYKSSIEIIHLVQNKHLYLDHKNTHVNSILFTEDDEILITCCSDQKIILWNYKESQRLFEFQGHKSSVESIDLSQNGQILASCSQTTIYLWNIKTFQLISQIEGHTKTINKLKFLSDGQTFISWGEDNMFMVWQTKDGKQVRCIERRTKTSQDPICFSQNDKILAQQCQNQIQLWDLELGKIITIIEGQSKPIRAMQFQPVSQILASLNEKENIIHLWDVKTKKYSTQPDGHNLEVNLVGFSPDGKIIFSWGKDEQIKLWTILEGKHCKSLKNIKNCIGIEFSHQGEFLLIQSDFNYIWYYIEGRVITLNKPQGSLPVAKMNELHTNGDLLVIVEKFSKQYSIQKANLKFMDLKLKQETNKMIEANSSYQILKFSKNGELLVYKFYSQILIFNLKLNQEFLIKKDTDQIQLSQNGQMILIKDYWEFSLYNVQTKQLIVSFRNAQRTKFSPNNQILASINQNTIIIRNAENGNQITILTGHIDKIIKITFSSEGKTLASLDEKGESICLWDMERFELLKILNGHQTKIKKILFSNLYQNLAAISSQSYIIIWNYLEGQQLAMLEDHKAELKMALFTPNHQKLLSLDDSLIILWDAHTWKQIKTFENNYYTYYSKKTLGLSPDGSILAMCNDRFIKILKLEEKSVHYLIGHYFNVQKVVFSSDGCSLFSSSNKENNEDCIIQWNISTCTLESLIEGDILKREEMILSYDDQKLAQKNGYCDIILYDADSGKQIALFQGHKHVIEQIIFSPNSHYLASCSRDLSIIIWDLNKLNQYTKFVGCDLIQRIIFSPDSSILVSSEMNFTVRVWNIQTKQQISKILIQTATQNFSDLSFSPDGQLLVLSNKKSLYLWNLKEDETLSLKVISEGKFYKFSSDGNQLLTYKKNLSKIICFDVIKQNVMYSNQDFKGTKGQWQFFPDFNIFLLIKENKIQFYDLRNSKLLASFEEHTNKINQFSVSPDNQIIVTCSDDSTVKLTSIQDLWQKENFSKNQTPLILSSYKTLAKYSPITAQLCQIKGAQIKSTIGWDLKQLFLQKGAIESEE